MHPHYRDPLPLGDPNGLPYSKGVMARALVAAGVGIESAYVLATPARARPDRDRRPGRRARAARGGGVRGARRGARARRSCVRLRRLAALQSLDVPIVLLVGGATGTGKSTVATEAAHRLGITRVTSTDFIRQTIRAYFPRSEMPSVHASSFEAGGEPGGRRGRLPRADPPCARRRRGLDRAGAQRGLVDGDRGRPPRAGHGPDRDRGRAARPRRAARREHRGAPEPLRRPGRRDRRRRARSTSTSTASTRSGELQELIVERAVRYDVPVIESTSIEATTAELLDLVLSRAAERAGLSPEEALAASAASRPAGGAERISD